MLLRACFRALGTCPSCGANFVFAPWSAAVTSIVLIALLFLFIWVAGLLHSLFIGITLIALWPAIVGGVHTFVPVIVMPAQAVRHHGIIGLVLVIFAVAWIVISNSLRQNGIHP